MKVEIVNAIDIPFSAVLRLKDMATEEGYNITRKCYEMSEERWVGVADNVVACVWGLIPPTLLSDRAYLWLYHNDLVEAHKFRFIRHSQVQMKEMLKRYPNIVGHCLINNVNGKQWLRWLGAEFSSPEGQCQPFRIKA